MGGSDCLVLNMSIVLFVPPALLVIQFFVTLKTGWMCLFLVLVHLLVLPPPSLIYWRVGAWETPDHTLPGCCWLGACWLLNAVGSRLAEGKTPMHWRLWLLSELSMSLWLFMFCLATCFYLYICFVVLLLPFFSKCISLFIYTLSLLFIRHFIYLFVYMFICFFYLFIYLFIHLFIY